MKIVFATNNPNKLKEVQSILGDKFEILSLKDVNIETDIPEDHETLWENALQKAEFIYNMTNLPCFADDTGLKVDALNGAPGVYSARYAGENATSNENIDKLLKELGNNTDRIARFKTVIAFVTGKQNHFFEGVCNGQILNSRQGGEGFGYDPVFMPDGYSVSFAEMSSAEKNKISHRGLAVQKFAKFMLELS